MPKWWLSFYKMYAGLRRLMQTNPFGILLGLGGGIKLNNMYNARNKLKMHFRQDAQRGQKW